jgi:RNA polymerase sigma factor (sigma-70 family)
MADTALADMVRLAIAGDKSAWNSITERFTPLVWSIARSCRLNDADAADVVQTTWLRLVEQLDRIREPERLAGWLSTTARNECINVIRRSGRELIAWTGDEGYDAADTKLAPVDLALLEEERDVALWLAFEQLPARCQALLRVLVASEPTAYAEIASSMGMPIGSIGPTRMRCLERLRRIFAESDYSFDLNLES